MNMRAPRVGYAADSYVCNVTHRSAPMTKSEYARLQLATKASAARTLMLWVATLLRPSLGREAHQRSANVSAIRSKLSTLRGEYLGLTFPELQAVESDLRAQVAAEEFDSLAAEFLAAVELIDRGRA